jgi:hypothetical protein
VRYRVTYVRRPLRYRLYRAIHLTVREKYNLPPPPASFHLSLAPRGALIQCSRLAVDRDDLVALSALTLKQFVPSRCPPFSSERRDVLIFGFYAWPGRLQAITMGLGTACCAEDGIE